MSLRTKLARAYDDLATMLDAGMPILRSLDVVIEGRQGYFKRLFTQIRETITQGSSLAEALGQHRNIFRDLDRMLIEAAETSGSLGDALKMLAHWHEFTHRIVRRIIIGLLYPLLILHIAALVFPIPFLVLRSNFTAGDYLISVLRLLLLLYIPAGVVLVFVLLREKAPLLRLPLDFTALKIPILGRAIYHLSICRYTTTFGMLYKAGVPITETTRRATRATGNAIVAKLFAGATDSVRQGGLAWEGFSKRLPTEYLNLWQIGEETGELDRVTDKIVEISSDRADLMFTEFARWMPRIIYFIILGILAVLVLLVASQVYGNLPTF